MAKKTQNSGHDSKPHRRVAPENPCQPAIDAANRGELVLNALSRSHYPGAPFPDDSLPGLLSVGYWNSRTRQNWGLPWHRNEGLEIEFLEAGYISFGVNRNEYSLGPGQLAITRPWQSHRYGSPYIDVCKLSWLILDVGVCWPDRDWQWPGWLVLTPEDLKRLAWILRCNETTIHTVDSDVSHCFRRLVSTLDETSVSTITSRLAVRINELLLALLDLLSKKVTDFDEHLSSSSRTTELFLESLRNDQDSLRKVWTVPKMAAACGISQAMFNTYCRLFTNRSPADYLRVVRLEAGRNALLADPDATVADIACQVGFTLPSILQPFLRKSMGLCRLCSAKATPFLRKREQNEIVCLDLFDVLSVGVPARNTFVCR